MGGTTVSKRAFVLCLLTCAVVAASVAAAGPTWVLLGERTVTDRLDHDTIVVTADRGEFSAVKVMVLKHAVDFHRFVVTYGNGDTDVLEVRRTIPSGDETRTLDFKGGRRVIKRIDFWYDAHTLGGRRAVIRALGLR
jgi:hypothetical protein